MALDTNVNPPFPTADQLLAFDVAGNVVDVNNPGVIDHVIRQTTLDGSVTASIPEPSTLVL